MRFCTDFLDVLYANISVYLKYWLCLFVAACCSAQTPLALTLDDPKIQIFCGCCLDNFILILLIFNAYCCLPGCFCFVILGGLFVSLFPCIAFALIRILRGRLGVSLLMLSDMSRFYEAVFVLD